MNKILKGLLKRNGLTTRGLENKIKTCDARYFN